MISMNSYIAWQHAFRRIKVKRHRLAIHFSSKKEDHETPQHLFDRWNRLFKFDIDLAANRQNRKCKRYLGPGSPLGEDALQVEWHRLGASGWLNCPYGIKVILWVKKAFEESEKGMTVVLLLASRTDTRWFKEIVEPYAKYKFLKRRIKFVGSKDPAPFPSILVIFSPETIRLGRKRIKEAEERRERRESR